MIRVRESIFRLVALMALMPSVVSATRSEIQILLSLLVVLVGFRLRRSSEIVLQRFIPLAGFALPLVPWIGSEVITGASLLAVVVLMPLTGGLSSLRWSGPFLLFLFGGVVAEIFSALGGLSPGPAYLSIVRFDEWPRARDALRTLIQVQLPTLNAWSRFFLLAVTVEFFSTRGDLRERWARGLWGGSFVSALFALLQSAGFVPFTLQNQTPFWSSINRVSGLMSDPNALGLMMVLALWCRLISIDPRQGWRGGEWLVVATLMGAGLVSGSRTFLLGLFLLICVFTFVRAHRLFISAIGVVSLAILTVSVLDHRTTLIASLVGAESIPEGARRGLMALSLPRLSETLFSRRIFIEIGVALWRESPWFGVGADQFRTYVPIVGARLGNLRGWIDNSNNFYLGVMAELGVVGAITLFMSAMSRLSAEGFSRQMGTGALLAVGCLLLTGPHLDFSEVLLLTGCLIGSSSVARGGTVLISPLFLYLAFVLGALSTTAHERGAYRWEEQGAGFERWLSPDARIRVMCAELGSGQEAATLRLRALYIPRHGGLQVTITSEGKAPQQLSLFTQEPTQVSIPCDRLQPEVWVRVVTTPAWSPGRAWPESSRDFRILGLRQMTKL